MVRVLLIILLSAYAFGSLQSLEKTIVAKTAFEYVGTNFVRDTTTTNSNDDAIDENVPIGFSFPFNGSTYTHVSIDSNGWFSFTAITSVYTNRILPYKDVSIYPYWDDLNPQSGGRISYGTIGTGANQHFVIYWSAVPHYPNTGRYTFQAVLYKNGDIRFRYDSNSNVTGSSSTIGIQEDNVNYDQHVFNDVYSFDASKDILYHKKIAVLSMLKDSCAIFDPINNSSNPKRISGATIRYAIEVSNSGGANAEEVKVSDTVQSSFNSSSIRNLQVTSGTCDCVGVASASNNGANGTADGVAAIVLDFGDVVGGTVAIPTTECGYFEVDLL